jgi:hypothetical protein
MLKSELVYRLGQDARESWDYLVCDDCVRIFEIPKVVVPTSAINGQFDGWLNGNVWFELFFRIRQFGQHSDYACIVEMHLESAERWGKVKPNNACLQDNRDGAVFPDSRQFVDNP